VHVVPVIALCLAFLRCDPDQPGTVDPTLIVPTIANLGFGFSTIDSDSIFVGAAKLPEDVLHIDVPVSVDVTAHTGVVRFSGIVMDADGDVLSSSASLRDDGVAPDGTPDDLRFTGNVAFEVERSRSGSFAIQLSVSDESGLSGNTLGGHFAITRLNRPPVVSNVVADTLISKATAASTITIRVSVSDTNGLADIQRVWFDAFLPNGNPSSSNPILMYDDGLSTGASGDQVAGDGVYSIITASPAGASVGTYRFSFHAIDRSRDSSNVIDHFLKVVP